MGPYPVMGGGSVTPLYGLCRYVKSQRVQFFRHFGLTWGIKLAIMIINRVMGNNNDHQQELFIPVTYVLDNCVSRNDHK